MENKKYIIITAKKELISLVVKDNEKMRDLIEGNIKEEFCETCYVEYKFEHPMEDLKTFPKHIRREVKKTLKEYNLCHIEYDRDTQKLEVLTSSTLSNNPDRYIHLGYFGDVRH